VRNYSAFHLGVCAYARRGIYLDGIFKVFRSEIFHLSLFLRNLIFTKARPIRSQIDIVQAMAIDENVVVVQMLP
jgi:hypothetical protein